MSRRAVLGAAAWSVPAIALSVSSPAYAASAPSLHFVTPSVQLVPGGTASVGLRAVGQAIAAGELIGVTLSDGLRLAPGGEKSGAFATDASGAIAFEVTGDAAGVITAFLSSDPSVTAVAPVVLVESSLDVGVESTKLLAAVTEDHTAAQARENRRYPHSPYQPTGRFVRAGEVIELVAAENPAVIEIAVGLYGPYEGLNGGRNVEIAAIARPSGNVVTASRDGMVFVRNLGSAPQRVELAGGMPVPTFVLGETSVAQFRRQLAERATAPFVSLVGRRVYGDFQYAIAAPYAETLPRVLPEWDRVVAETDRVYGLGREYGGVARRSSNRVYIANPDWANDAYATASYYRVSFPVDSGADADLFRNPAGEQWGFWHEVGHTYQTPQYLFGVLVETTVNISPLAIQDAAGWPNRNDEDERRAAVAEFRRAPLGSRDWATMQHGVVALLMFDQLRRAFGEDFYPRLSQEYRVMRALGQEATDQVQTFLRLTSAVAGRNLERFFLEYGLAADQESRAAMAAYPEPEVPIWDNHDRATDRSIDSVRPYVVPMATVSLADDVTLLQGGAAAVRLSHAANSDGRGSVRVEDAHLTYSLNPDTAAGTAVIVNDRGVRNVVPVQPGTFSMGTSIEFGGYGSVAKAWLALRPESGTLRTGSVPDEIHYFFPDQAYFAVTVTQPDGTSVHAGAEGRGGGKAAAFAAALDGVPYQVGTTLTVQHVEPTRLRFWVRGEQQPSSASATQVYIVTAPDVLSRA